MTEEETLHEEEKKKAAEATARYNADVRASQAEVAKELVPCPTCGTTVARVQVCEKLPL